MLGSNRFCRFSGWSSPNQPPRWRSRPADPGDREVWGDLFERYCAFYERPSDSARCDRVWSWIEDGTVRCLLAVPIGDDAPAVGLAHLRPCPSPLRGTYGGYLDDLYASAAVRGSGVFEALIAGIRSLAQEEGWEIVRWITATDNDRARSAYERVATRTEWVTYQLDI